MLEYSRPGLFVAVPALVKLLLTEWHQTAHLTSLAALEARVLCCSLGWSHGDARAGSLEALEGVSTGPPPCSTCALCSLLLCPLRGVTSLPLPLPGTSVGTIWATPGELHPARMMVRHVGVHSLWGSGHPKWGSISLAPPG